MAPSAKKLYGKIVEGVIRSTFVVDEKGNIEVAQYNVKAAHTTSWIGKQLKFQNDKYIEQRSRELNG